MSRHRVGVPTAPDACDTAAEQEAYYADCQLLVDEHTPDEEEL